jgi:hypothetical protein
MRLSRAAPALIPPATSHEAPLGFPTPVDTSVDNAPPEPCARQEASRNVVNCSPWRCRFWNRRARSKYIAPETT